MYSNYTIHTFARWLLLSTVHTSVLSQNTSGQILAQHEVNQHCLVLSQHGQVLPRCNSHELTQPLDEEQASIRCPAGDVNINFLPAEIKPGFRLVGNQRGDKFSCYPLSDEDFWRSRKAVPGDLRRLAHVIGMAQRGLAVRVAVIGGSVTHGNSCASYALAQGLCGWAHRFVEWLKDYHRNPNIKLFNLGVPSTTSAWRLSHFDEVLAVRPDLLIVDYGINDSSMNSTPEQKAQYIAMCRTTTERLIRRFLEAIEEAKEAGPRSRSARRLHLNPQAALLFLDVHRGMRNAPDEKTISFGAEVYHSVCRAYDVPLVSVRDAIWPEMIPIRPDLWDTTKGPHPTWSGHQLIADILAFSWTLAGKQSLRGVSGHLLDSQASVPEPATDVPMLLRNTTSSIQKAPYLFESARSNELNVCPGSKYLSNPPSVAAGGLKPSRPDTNGWQLVDHNGKVGWEYSLVNVSKPHHVHLNNESVVTNSSLSTRRHLKLKDKRNTQKHRGPSSSDRVAAPPVQPLPLANRNEHVEDLPGIISFPGRFKADDPGLLVEYLRSYANYGQAIVFVTTNMSQPRDRVVKKDNMPVAAAVWPSYAELESRARAMLRLAWADHRFVSLCTRAKTKNINDKEKRINFSSDCNMILADTWKDPAVLDGFWHDRSSQVDIEARKGSLRIENDIHVPGHPPRTVRDTTHSLFHLPGVDGMPSSRLPKSKPSRNKDRIPSASSDDAAVIEGEVHFMIVPWSNAIDSERVKFKVMGVNAC